MEKFADIIGIAGTAIMILAFFLLQARKLRSNSNTYLLMNLTGSLMLLLSLLHTFNFALFITQLFWIGISAYGMWKKTNSNNNTGI